ncbi:MAG: hypothetical protein GY750_20445, partial [Lentisphaerae bacterium]|nr:hypothetical protein [Lentisphaerota bacterium]MCP4103765.1 hypothetical protein [Lentisphaerota bacterium]
MPDFYDNLYNNIKDLSKNCPGFEKYYSLISGGNRDGFCYALTHSWGFAVLANEQEKFFSRLKIMVLDYNQILSHGGYTISELNRLAS